MYRKGERKRKLVHLESPKDSIPGRHYKELVKSVAWLGSDHSFIHVFTHLLVHLLNKFLSSIYDFITKY